MNKKNLKGMTLVEIIVSMAIFAMLGMILVTLGTNVDTTTKSANRLNKRVAIQAPYAASQDTEYSYEVSDEDGNVSTVNARLSPNLTNIEVYIDNDNNNTADIVSVKKAGRTEREDVDSDTKIYGSRYSTKAVVDNTSGKEVYDPDEVSNSEHHLQFISVFDRLEIDKTLTVGETFQIKYDGLDEDGNAAELEPTNCVWSSTENADTVATISSGGLITAVGAGDCIYVGEADGGIKMTVTVTVNE